MPQLRMAGAGWCFGMVCWFLLLTNLLYRTQVVGSSVLVADFRMTRMVELSSRPPYCKIHSDRGDIQRMLLASDTKKVRQVPRESVIALEEVCGEASDISGELQGGLGFIYPGTKWCGPGNIATNHSDVGRYAAEDQCCREHDLCPNVLLPGECRRGLCNRGTFTRSHCDCDARFRRCLQNLNTETANTLGAIFFNVVQVTCFGERRPCSVWQSGGHTGYDCPTQFYRSGTYSLPYGAAYNKHISLRNSRSFDVGSSNDITDGNRVGFNETEADELCSRWKYRPSEKYIPIMQQKSNK